MTPDELEARGKRFFDKLHPEDKAALKWFLTGQIQNILANQHGIGGSKGIREAVQEKASQRINQLIGDKEFQIRLAERLAQERRIDFPKLIIAAAQKEAEKQIEQAAGYAARRVRVHVTIEPDPERPAGAEGFGQF
jgi:hypothetical protein